MSEWFKERAWKVRIRQKRIQGSNPCLSATIFLGEVAEWSIVLDSKSSVPPGTVGSNPTLSALIIKDLQRKSARVASLFFAPNIHLTEI